MEESYLDNPGALKIDLMLRGLRVDPSLEGVIGLAGRAGVGIDLVLAKGMPANVPSGEEFTADSPYVLKRRGRRACVITDGSGEVPVTVVPPPRFYGLRTKSGVSFSDIATVHGSYVVIMPSPGCDFFNREVECRYCAGNFNREGGRRRTYTVDEVLETVEAVQKEGASGIIYLSIGFNEGDDGGIGLLAPYIKAIKKHFNRLVAVEALPPKKNHWIDETYAIGADSVLYNLEIFDEELFELICPGIATLIGRKRYIEALGYATTIFPSGTVASHLIVGLEPPGSTVMGIDFLTGMGVVPILPIYRPRPGMALRIEPLNAEVIIPIYRQLYNAVKRNSINMNWVKDISIVTTPTEARFLSDEASGGLDAIVENFYKTRLGLKTAWGLSTLRRKLRVKEAKGPLDSSGK